MKADIHSTEALYDDGRFRLVKHILSHERFDGGSEENISRIVFERRPCVAIIASNAACDRLVLTEQFRPGLIGTKNPWTIELPAGIIDEGEDALAAARRECLEETGVEPSTVRHLLHYFSSPGACSERLDICHAVLDLSQVARYAGLAGESEDIRTHIVSLDEAREMIASNRIVSAHTLVGLLYLMSASQI